MYSVVGKSGLLVLGNAVLVIVLLLEVPEFIEAPVLFLGFR